MAKGCLNKLTGNVLVTCDIVSVGVSDIYLIYPEDVTLTMTDEGRRVSAMAFAPGAKSYRIEGYKQNIQITTAMRSLDASARLDVSIKFMVPGKSPFTNASLLGGKFYVLEVPLGLNTGTTFNLWGINCPLECTSWEHDSNANGRLATVTLSAPEGSAGNNSVVCLTDVRDSIIAKSV